MRASYESDSMEFALAVAQEAARERSDRTAADAEHRGVRRWIAEGAWSEHKALQIELHALRHDDCSRTEAVGQPVTPQDADESDARLTWLGVAARGEIGGGRLQYWLDAVRVRGNEKLVDIEAGVVDSVARRRVGGWGFDAALRWSSATRTTAPPSIPSCPTCASRPSAPACRCCDRARSTSCSTTIAKSWGPRRLRSARFEPALTGVQRSVGRGFDVVLALEEWGRVEFNLIASALRAGAAFGALQGKRYPFVITALRVAF